MTPLGPRRFATAALFVAALACADTPPAIPLKAAQQLLSQGRFVEAVAALEAYGTTRNADPAYRASLREAYAELGKTLELENRPESAAAVRAKLKLFDEAKPPKVVAARPAPTAVRGQSEEVTPTGLSPADAAFNAQRYVEAARLFASDAAHLSPEQSRRWAYCRVAVAVESLNAAPTADWAGLENEVTTALALDVNNAALQQFGAKVLNEVKQRKAVADGPPVAVQHSAARGSDGWYRAESANFVLYHAEGRELAEGVVRAAEAARREAFARWAGTAPEAWKPACQLVLYHNGADYKKATNQDAQSPGHSTLKSSAGQVVARRVELRADNPNLLMGVLPHEIAHVVLGDLFPEGLPRWADEGMAVLSEPRAQIDRYRRTLHRLKGEGKLLPVAGIVGEAGYPAAEAITAFYAESVSLVEFLVAEKGERELVAFLRDANRGFDAALQQHYGMSDAVQWQDRWLARAFGGR